MKILRAGVRVRLCRTMCGRTRVRPCGATMLSHNRTVAQESHSHKTVAQSHKSRTKRRCATHFFDSSFIFHHFEDLPLVVSLFPHGFLFHISDQNYANFLSLILKFINLPFLTHFRVFERWCLTFCATFCATHRITLLCDYFAPCDRPFPACATVRCDPIFWVGHQP